VLFRQFVLTHLIASHVQEGDLEDTTASLTLLAEVLSSAALFGSFELISRLLETLSKVLQHASATQADLSYTVQLLMLAVENAADKVAVCSLLNGVF
jgi:hypothetical protein